MFSNGTYLAVVILNSSVSNISFAEEPFEKNNSETYFQPLGSVSKTRVLGISTTETELLEKKLLFKTLKHTVIPIWTVVLGISCPKIVFVLSQGSGLGRNDCIY